MAILWVFIGYLLLTLNHVIQTKCISFQEFELKNNPQSGPIRLGPPFNARSPLMCAVRCMEVYENCAGYLFNADTKNCTPASDIHPRQPAPTVAEGTLYHSFKCEARGFTTYTYQTTKACLLMFEKNTFSKADAQCLSLGGYLMSVKTEEKLALLIRNIWPKEVWIGCNKRDNDGVFRWKEDDEVLSSSVIDNVFSGVWPNYDCISYTSGNPFLFSDRCSDSREFYCELPLP